MHLAEPDEREAYRILDFALRTGEILLSGGAGAVDVTATTIALAQACGLRSVVSEVTFTSITLSYVRAPDVAPVTSVRLVQQRTPDYTRVTEIHNLVDDLVEQRITPATAMARLDEVAHRRHPYPRWVVTAFRALLAAAVAGLLGAGVLVTGIAFATTVVVDRATGALSARRLPDFYANAVGAAIATTVAVAVMVADLDVRPSLIVASGIVLLLPGVTLVGSVQDAISGFLLTASARAFEVFVLTAGIISGVAAVLSVADRFGVALTVTTQPAGQLGDVPVQALAATVAAAAAAGASYAPRRALPIAGLAGLLAWGRSEHSARPGSTRRCPPEGRRCCSARAPTCSPTTRRRRR
ncbi:threonine/serine exporter family protein [Blastococcus brunescens]|uniref:Threonine/serine exporter family protein n=1 Tax=Blastococcus brunescens TaxID=1564165 RepID=A0ABZ1BAP5_9ACTN|nr:threonine/serine exporter family protein [Blastococcus sp. BMG 8361]WRL66649.1 threonine/serine exporter family protein [Blastococcus sp. BMG 8361]